MKYFKLTKIDKETGISSNRKYPSNGEIFPDLPGLNVIINDAVVTEFWYATADDAATENPENQCWELSLSDFSSGIKASIAKSRTNKLKELFLREKEVRADLLGHYHVTVLLSGLYKYEQAKKVIEGNGVLTDEIYAEATLRGIDVEDLAIKIIDKHNVYRDIDTKISGIRGKLQDRLEGFTFNDLDPLTSVTDYLSTEDIGNGIILSKYDTDIMARVLPLI